MVALCGGCLLFLFVLLFDVVVVMAESLSMLLGWLRFCSVIVFFKLFVFVSESIIGQCWSRCSCDHIVVMDALMCLCWWFWCAVLICVCRMFGVQFAFC